MPSIGWLYRRVGSRTAVAMAALLVLLVLLVLAAAISIFAPAVRARR